MPSSVFLATMLIPGIERMALLVKGIDVYSIWWFCCWDAGGGFV